MQLGCTASSDAIFSVSLCGDLNVWGSTQAKELEEGATPQKAFSGVQAQIKSMAYFVDKEVLVVGDADGRIYHFDGASVGRRVRGEFHEDSPVA